MSRSRRQQAEAALRDVLDQASKVGFFGSCSVELTVNDGNIQHIRRRVEKVDRLHIPARHAPASLHQELNSSAATAAD